MSHGKNEPPPVDNIISDETGAFDLRFILWRHFCQQNSIPVETPPSQHDGKQKEKWEELKASRLRGQKKNGRSPRVSKGPPDPLLTRGLLPKTDSFFFPARWLSP